MRKFLFLLSFVFVSSWTAYAANNAPDWVKGKEAYGEIIEYCYYLESDTKPKTGYSEFDKCKSLNCEEPSDVNGLKALVSDMKACLNQAKAGFKEEKWLAKVNARKTARAENTEYKKDLINIINAYHVEKIDEIVDEWPPLRYDRYDDTFNEYFAKYTNKEGEDEDDDEE